MKRIMSLFLIGCMLFGTNVKASAMDTVSGNDLGTESFCITGIIQDSAVYEVTTLDVKIPIEGIYFNIDRDGTLYSQGMVIESNTSMPLNVYLIKV